MTTLNEQQQKTYVKISNIINNYSNLRKGYKKDFENSSELPEEFYQKPNLNTFISLVAISSFIALYFLMVGILILKILQTFLTDFTNLFNNTSIILIFLFIFICSFVSIYLHIENPYKFSKKFAIDIFEDDKVNKIFFEPTNEDSILIVDELPQNKKEILSHLRKLHFLLNEYNFYEYIGVKEDEKLKNILIQYEKIKSKIEEYDATDTHKNYWREKLNEFIEENKQYKNILLKSRK